MIRMRRLRKNKVRRDALAETNLRLNQLVTPLFIVQKQNFRKEIPSMPGIYQVSVDNLLDEVNKHVNLGLKQFILFGIPSTKDFEGKTAADPDGPVVKSLQLLDSQFGDEIELYADVCLCEYTTHGHCGIPNKSGEILNDPSLARLADAALAYAYAGADWVAPSNMMDNRVISIRQVLDHEGFENTAILSYSAKFASNYYGPFRDAAESPPSFGDRSTYQIDFRNSKQAIRELNNDEQQGADAVMVKPALPYLDIISKARAQTMLPLYAYNVSGEYAYVKFGVKAGIFNEKNVVLENLTAISRAGADMIITYHGYDIANNGWLK